MENPTLSENVNSRKDAIGNSLKKNHPMFRSLCHHHSQGAISPDAVSPETQKKVVDKMKFLSTLPSLDTPAKGTMRLADFAQWRSVFLFFNLDTTAPLPADYNPIAIFQAAELLDEGAKPCTPSINDFTLQYWRKLSRGRIRFTIDTLRKTNGEVDVPQFATPLLSGGVLNEAALRDVYLSTHAERIWEASGRLMKGEKRFVPSVVFINHWQPKKGYATTHQPIEKTVGGHDYIFQDWIWISISYSENGRQTAANGQQFRKFWTSPLMHEYAHNLLDAGDLYGPGGCTGYWDLLGDNEAPGVMSEVSSVFKQRVGWLEFKEVISGPNFSEVARQLNPYTSSGEAIKVIPDPVNNPDEYFVLEFRKSTGTEIWMPDGGLPESGLLITHINERLGAIAKPWFLREAPFFDPEYADFVDKGGALWTGINHLNFWKALYPTATNNSFTPTSSPNSNFYGGRPSGLHITGIGTPGNLISFTIRIAATSTVGWTTSVNDRGGAARLNPLNSNSGLDIFMRNNNSLALLQHVKGQVFVKSVQTGSIDTMSISSVRIMVSGNFRGELRESIFCITTGLSNFLIRHTGTSFITIGTQSTVFTGSGTASGQTLNSTNIRQMIAGDFDGDGRQEIAALTASGLFIIKWDPATNIFQIRGFALSSLGSWAFSNTDQMFGGKFRSSARDSIVLVRNNQVAHVELTAGLVPVLQSFQTGVIGGLNLATLPRFTPVMFSGGIHSLYVRSGAQAFVLRMGATNFGVVASAINTIPHVSGAASLSLTLTNDDFSLGGTFFPPAEGGIIHRNGGRIALLRLTSSGLRVVFALSSDYIAQSPLTSLDKFITGDFHVFGAESISQPGGDETVPVAWDPITNRMTDVFIHNGVRTAVLTLNYEGSDVSSPTFPRFEWGYSWLSNNRLLLL